MSSPSQPSLYGIVVTVGSGYSARRRRARLRTYEDDLPRLAFERCAWMDRARCKDSRTRWFFPPRGADGQFDMQAARALCDECTVIAECGAYALRHRIYFGLWGGMSVEQRRAKLGLKNKKRSVA
jgi:WhiB family transcriptional regulator, redox-sensing transcriptional regulator